MLPLKRPQIKKRATYIHDIATLKKYRENYYRITLHRAIRRSEYEAEDTENNQGLRKTNAAENENKLGNSLSRTRSTIFELAMCNNWEWFVTLTLNPEKYDRTDLHQYRAKLSTWIRNYNRLHKTTIKYLLIPEVHSDKKSYHMHGLIMGLPEDHLHEFREEEKLPLKILMEIVRGHRIYSWPAYEKAFGYITVSKIKSMESVSKYITKYITKELYNTQIALNNHLYYCSKGLRRAEIIREGPLTREIEEDYSNEYVKVKTLRSLEEAEAYFQQTGENDVWSGEEEIKNERP